MAAITHSHYLVQADSSSVEAVMLGFFMGDAHYIDLANKGVHSWLCCMELGMEFTPDNVEVIKEKHKGLYGQMKVTNHMTNYGGTPYVLWQTYPELFKTKKDAERAQGRIFQLIPTLAAYHHAVRYTAQKQSWLETPWRVRHYFFDVFTNKRDRFGNVIFDEAGRPKVVLGKDGKRCVAFKSQSSNGSFQRDNLLLLGATEAREWMPANVTVHDSACLDTPFRKVDRAIELLLEVMPRPIAEMGNLRIGCEVEVGLNWSDFDSKKNPNGMKSVAKLQTNLDGVQFDAPLEVAA